MIGAVLEFRFLLHEEIISIEKAILTSPGGLLSMDLITVKMSNIYVDGLDRLVELGMYPSRSEAIRVAIRDLLRRELWVDGVPVLKKQDAEVSE
ncbi:MAG: ribbon-helix-helix domain-containing protein [Candidatus Thorarchaeota archaeon]|jgi:hypothetical protein